MRKTNNMFAKILLMAFVSLFGVQQAAALSIDPANIGLYFDKTDNSGNDFRVMFGNLYHNDPQLVNFTLNINEANGTASVFISGLHGKVYDDVNFRGDAPALGNAVMDIAFSWSGLYRDANGNLVSRTPTGGGTIATITSSYFQNGPVTLSLSPKGSTNTADWGPLATPSNPLFFFLGDKPDAFKFYADQIFSAWFMGDNNVNVNGGTYFVTGDFHGQAPTDVPEPTSMLLLGSSLLIAPLRKRMQKA